ncbi:MAG TPA: hypothetical protein VKQ08_02170 [Cyclobacteriaceae bacterium]|nr:hypothetical protein [Cyclobacteriaceae bacterium]
MENEFGELIDESEIDTLTKRIRRLSSKALDDLWNRVGFVIDHEEDGFEAITAEIVRDIQNSFQLAREAVKNLLMESHLTELKRVLIELERSDQHHKS